MYYWIDFFLLMIAIPFWVLLFKIAQGTMVGRDTLVVVLAIMTAVFWYVLRERKHSLTISILGAGLLSVVSLFVIGALTEIFS